MCIGFGGVRERFLAVMVDSLWAMVLFLALMSLAVTVCAWLRTEFLVAIVGFGMGSGEYLWPRKDELSGGTLVGGAGSLTETPSCGIGGLLVIGDVHWDVFIISILWVRIWRN